MLKKFDKIVIKKEYSYSRVQVITFTRELLNDKNNFLKRLDQLNFKYFFDQGTNANFWEQDIIFYKDIIELLKIE